MFGDDHKPQYAIICFQLDKNIIQSDKLLRLIKNDQNQPLQNNESELDFIKISNNMNANKVDSKCQKCSLFFANEAFNGFCSTCYKESEMSNDKKHQDNKTCASNQDREIIEQFAGLSLKEQAKIEQKDKKRCFNCNKKTGLLGVQCKCGYIFCNSHRMPEVHECTFNHKAALNKELKIKLNKVDHGKIIQI